MRRTLLELALGGMIGLALTIVPLMQHMEKLNQPREHVEVTVREEQESIAGIVEESKEQEWILDPNIPENVQIAAHKYGDLYNICPQFLMAIAFCESSYNPDAVNDTCIGLMQINIDAQYERMDKLGITLEDLNNPYDNMHVAADYLQELFEKYEDVGIVLMVYNGDSRAERYAAEGKLSQYAINVLELSAELERYHLQLILEQKEEGTWI